MLASTFCSTSTAAIWSTPALPLALPPRSSSSATWRPKHLKMCICLGYGTVCGMLAITFCNTSTAAIWSTPALPLALPTNSSSSATWRPKHLKMCICLGYGTVCGMLAITFCNTSTAAIWSTPALPLALPTNSSSSATWHLRKPQADRIFGVDESNILRLCAGCWPAPSAAPPRLRSGLLPRNP